MSVGVGTFFNDTESGVNFPENGVRGERQNFNLQVDESRRFFRLVNVSL